VDTYATANACYETVTKEGIIGVKKIIKLIAKVKEITQTTLRKRKTEEITASK
jgi:hypothetical protein